MRKLGTLEFGPIRVSVVAKARVLVDDAECWGAWDGEAHVIELREEMPRGRFIATLFHEITHACQDILAKAESAENHWFYEREDIANAVGFGVGQNFDRIGRLWRVYRARKAPSSPPQR